MVFGGLFKGLFRGEDEEQRTGPLGLRIGAAIEVDTLRFRMVTDQLKFELPSETLFVTANGRIALDDGAIVLRYYTDQHTMFQVMCVGGEEDRHVQEVTLYVPHQSYYPEGQDWQEWEGEGGRLGQVAFRTQDGTLYERIWFGGNHGWARPVRYQERVVDDAGDARLITQDAMLFGREIKEGPGFGEYLLLAIEAHRGGRSVEAMVGVDLDPGMFRVI